MDRKLGLLVVGLAVVCGVIALGMGGCTGAQGGATPGDSLSPDTPSDTAPTGNDSARKSVTFTLNLANDGDAQASARGLLPRAGVEYPYDAAEMDLISIVKDGVRLGNDCVGDDGSHRTFNVFLINETGGAMQGIQVEIVSCDGATADETLYDYGTLADGEGGPGPAWDEVDGNEQVWSFSYTPPLNLTAIVEVSWAPPLPTGTFLTKWGGQGTGDGQFIQPTGIAADSAGNVYVTDIYSDRIQKFDSTGTFLTKWGSLGSGDGQFKDPYGIAVDSGGDVYVADRSNNRIQKFDSTGTFLTKWGTLGMGDGQLWLPSGVAVDSSGNVYVLDYINDRVQKFDSTGEFLTKWGSNGADDGEFYSPQGIAVDSGGNVYVTDLSFLTPMYGYRIQKFGSTGAFLTKWTSPDTDWVWRQPLGIAVDSDENVYVTDTRHRVQKFDSAGTFLTKWGSYGAGNGQFNYPWGIAVAPGGNVYVVDYDNQRVQKFSP